MHNSSFRKKRTSCNFYTLAVVDEGLLGLTAFKTENRQELFLPQSLMNFFNWHFPCGQWRNSWRITNFWLALLAEGSPSDEKFASQQERFQPVVFYFGPFELKKGEKKDLHLLCQNTSAKCVFDGSFFADEEFLWLGRNSSQSKKRYYAHPYHSRRLSA